MASRAADGVDLGGRRRAADLRHQRRGRADDRAAVHHRERAGRRGRPARGVDSGGRHVRHRRLVDQRLDARVPGPPGRGADRDHHRRFPQRDVRLLERFEGPPLHRPGEHRGRRGVAGDGRHRVAIGRGARRDLPLHDRRPGAGAGVHGGDHPRRVRGAAVLPARGHRGLFGTETFAWVSASRQENKDWVQGGVVQERESRGGQGHLVRGTRRPRGLLLPRRHERGQLPAAVLGRRLRAGSAVGSTDRRLDGGALRQSALPGGLGDPAAQHVRLPEGRRGALRRPDLQRRRLLPPAGGARRLAAAVPGEPDRRCGRTRVRADPRALGARRGPPRPAPLRRSRRRRARTAPGLRLLDRLPLRRRWARSTTRPAIRPAPFPCSPTATATTERSVSG